MADEVSLVKNLFTTVENNLFYGDQLGRGEFGTLMHPGKFISSRLNPVQDPNDGYTLFSLMNDVLDSTFIYSPLDRTVSDVYNEILTFAALPKKVLTADQLAEKAKDEKYLATNYETYQTWRDIAQRTELEYQKALRAVPQDPNAVQTALNAWNTAKMDWSQIGKKEDFDNAWADVKYLESGNPRTWFQAMKDRYSQYALNAPSGPYLTTLLDPAPITWDDAGWAEMTLASNDSASSSYSHSTSWSGGGGISFGFWSFGGSGGGSSTYTHDHSKVTNVSAKFKFLRATILRPWLVPDILSYSFWTWQKAHGWTDISTGGNLLANPPERPLGPRGMPFLQKEVLVIKDLVLTANFTETDNSVITSNINGSASFGWGPFSVSGSYSEGTTQKNAQASMRDGSLFIPQPQIIAFLGTLTPKCPNPAPGLAFDPDEIATPTDAHSDYLDLFRSIAATEYANRLAATEFLLAQASEQAAVSKKLEEVRTKLIRGLNNRVKQFESN